MAEKDSSAPANQGSWPLTIALSVALVGGGFLLRNKSDAQAPAPQPKGGAPQVKLPDEKYLPRTRKLVRQKIGSLEAYNQKIAEADQLAEFRHWTGNREVKTEAFTAMSQLMVDRVIPDLWLAAQKKAGEGKMVTRGHIADVLHHAWPQRLLPNGHVVMFPNHPRLRLVASEPRQDYFRDTGWHWRWIGQSIDNGTLGDLSKVGELDIYAAEELSEFMSVLAVAVLEWTDQLHEPALPNAPISRQFMGNTLALMQKLAQDSQGTSSHGDGHFSVLTRKQVLDGVPQPMFADATERVGLKFMHAPDKGLEARRTELYMPTGIAGGGVSAGDFDGDGFMDLYFAGGTGGELWRNVEGKRFENATAKAGLSREGETRAGYFVDYDNDGDLDLFLTVVFQANRLYRNEGDGRFTDVTEATGVGGGKHVTHEAVWFDFDNDGLLDFYVANFGTWPNGDNPDLTIRNKTAPPNQLFHHQVIDGKHVFKEVAATMGVDDRGWTHCVGAWDFDQDGWMDLISLNDFGRTIAYRNLDGKKFEEETRVLHLDTVYNAMNFHLIDLEHTGHPAMYVTEISKLTHRVRYPKPVTGTKIRFRHLEEMRTLVVNKLLRRSSTGTFENVHDIHIEPAQLGWAWDASTFDYENDGDLDLLVLNGTVGMPEAGPVQSQKDYLSRHAMQNNVFFLSQNKYFYDVSPKSVLAYKGNSRGSAWFDFDNDGDIDCAINDYHGPGRIFENTQKLGNRWVRLELEGTAANRNAVGARVEIQYGNAAQPQRRFSQVVSGKGFISQDPMALHFGLGGRDKVSRAIITWPGGKKQTLENLAAGQVHRIKQPAAAE